MPDYLDPSLANGTPSLDPLLARVRQGGQQPMAPTPPSPGGYQDPLMQRIMATPGALEHLLGLSSIADKRSMAEEQLARAAALRKNEGQRHLTGMGAALGGIGDVINAYRSGKMQDEAVKEQRALIEQRQEQLKMLGRTIAGAQQPQGGGGMSGPVDGAPPSMSF